MGQNRSVLLHICSKLARCKRHAFPSILTPLATQSHFIGKHSIVENPSATAAAPVLRFPRGGFAWTHLLPAEASRTMTIPCPNFDGQALGNIG